MNTPYRQIRADYDDETLVVYQAYPPQIADEALRLGTFGPSFSRSRMTWIKPSFRWMLYRCGWAAKPGQERVLAVQIRRDSFEWALRNSGLSHYDAALHADRAAWEATRHRPVRLQWDPERDPRLRPLDHRSLQIGISGDAVTRYCDQWISAIDDATDLAHAIGAHVTAGRLGDAAALLPPERPYPVPDDIAAIIGSTPDETPHPVR